MRRSTIALLSVLALSATACAMPGAVGSARYSTFGDNAAAPTSAPADGPVVLRRSGRHAASVLKFVRAHKAQLQFCQDLERAKNPSFAGKATIEVTLEDNGYVLRARVADRSWNADGASVEDCMLTAIRRWDFPDSGPLDEFVHAFSVTLGEGAPHIDAPREQR